MTALMHQGKSWSGNERNCSYLNLADGSFVDVSSLGGLDFPDDGRSLAVSDWDGDGDLDVWLKNRTGPQLRFLRNNQQTDHRFIALKLKGKTCNRDAVGAKVTVEAGGRTMTRTLLAGEGYLAQSSKWLHFGLGEADAVSRVEITWPDGARQELGALVVNRRYHVEQYGRAVSVPNNRSMASPIKPADVPDHDGAARIVLKVPLPMPPDIRRVLGDRNDGSVKLLNLWAHWCRPCREELSLLMERQAELTKAGLEVIALNLDKPEDQKNAKTWFQKTLGSPSATTRFTLAVPEAGFVESLDSIFHHVRDKEGNWSLPTSFLIDPQGGLQIIYLGPVSVDRLLTDAQSYGRNAIRAHLRGPYPGRWYFRMLRNLPDLASDLAARGRKQDAAFYERLSPPAANDTNRRR